jgi:hypothetical protein
MNILQENICALNKSDIPNIDDVAIDDRTILIHEIKNWFSIDEIRGIDILDEMRDIGAIDGKTVGVPPESTVP